MKKAIAACILAILPSAGFAFQDLECNMTAHTPAGWISKKLFLQIEDGAPYVDVIDGYTNEFSGGWVRAPVIERSSSHIRFQWTVDDIPLSNRRLRVSATYVAHYTPKTGKLRLRVYLSGMDMDPPRGSGKCKPYQKKKK